MKLRKYFHPFSFISVKIHPYIYICIDTYHIVISYKFYKRAQSSHINSSFICILNFQIVCCVLIYSTTIYIMKYITKPGSWYITTQTKFFFFASRSQTKFSRHGLFLFIAFIMCIGSACVCIP